MKNNKREQFGWAMYDWANSAFSTTVAVVFLGPYVADLARKSAEALGETKVSLLGLAISPDSFLPYCISISVFLQIFFLPILGAMADYSQRRSQFMRVFATIGAITTILMFFVTGGLWWLGGLLFIIANLCFGAAIVFYNAFLPDIADEEERDRVSAYGWAMGYLGGGILLLLNLVLYLAHESLGLSAELAVRLNLASAGVWWLGWAYLTWQSLPQSQTIRQLPPNETLLTVGFKQLRQTFSEAKHYPQTLRYLLAYLIYNDGIQTVIAVSSIFAAAPLLQGGMEMDTSALTMLILMIQFVAFLGALFWGRLAGWIGTKNALTLSLIIWSGVVTFAFVGLRGDTRITQFWVLGACIAVVMGGSQAISRSLFSQMIPHGKEAEFFSVYEISERGTSWLGPFLFGLFNDLFGNLRPAIFALILFFVIGLILFQRVNIPQAIRDAGNNPEGVKL